MDIVAFGFFNRTVHQEDVRATDLCANRDP